MLLRRDEYSCAGHHHGQLCAAEKLFGDQHRVARSVLRLLHNDFGAERLDDRGHLFRLMTYHNHSRPRLQRFTSANNVLHKSSSARAVQNFCEARLQARALACGKDNHC